MPFWKCYYHVIWATKRREPTILPAYESVIHAAIEQRSQALRCTLLAVNSVSDHIHVAVSIAPSVSVAQWVGSIKGASARAVNTSFIRDTRFHWQEGYGVMTFGEKNLETVLAYIANQKEHHANDDLNTYLEYTEE